MNRPTQAEDDGLRTVFRGAGVSYVAQLFGTVVNFAHTVALARFYGRDGLGLYSTGFPLARYLTLLGVLGLDSGLVRFLPIHRRREEPGKIAGLLGWSLRAVALMSGLLAVLLWLGADVVGSGVFGEPGLAPLLRVFAFVVPVWALVMVLAAAAQSFDRQDYRAIPQTVVQPALQLALVLLFGWMGYVVTSAVAARGWAMLAGLAVAVVLQRRLGPLGLRSWPPAHERRELLRFAFPTAAAGLVMSLCSSLALLMTTALAGRAETGLYAAAFRVTFIGILMLRSFTWSFDPFISRLLEAGETAQLRRLLQAVTKALLAVNLPLAALFILLADPVASLFGPEFLPAARCMRILALDSVVVSLAYLADHLVLFSGRPRLVLANGLGLLAVMFGSDLLLIPSMGAEGAAWASLAAHSALLIAVSIEVALLLRLTFFGPAQANIFLAAGAATAASFAIRHFFLASLLGPGASLVTVAVYAAVYLPLLLLSLTPEDRATLRRALDRARGY